jgi:hypothetical protein
MARGWQTATGIPALQIGAGKLGGLDYVILMTL